MTGTAREDAPTGYDRLHKPRLNKGTAFTEAERRSYRIEGLLPPACITTEIQVARVHAQLPALDDDLQKYLVLWVAAATSEGLDPRDDGCLSPWPQFLDRRRARSAPLDALRGAEWR